jgi:hypothetical protein
MGFIPEKKSRLKQMLKRRDNQSERKADGMKL